MKKISVRITKKAEITVSTEGFSGEECLRATERLEASLGKVGTPTPTAEMYEAERERTRD